MAGAQKLSDLVLASPTSNELNRSDHPIKGRMACASQVYQQGEDEKGLDHVSHADDGSLPRKGEAGHQAEE